MRSRQRAVRKDHISSINESLIDFGFGFVVIRGLEFQANIEGGAVIILTELATSRSDNLVQHSVFLSECSFHYQAAGPCTKGLIVK